jgi:N-acetylglucosamine-6-phosphate deacetylase
MGKVNSTLKLSGPTLLDDGLIREATVTVAGGEIVEIGHGRDTGADIITDGVIAPGCIDMQLNGAYGHDFTVEPSSIAAVAAHLPQTGVTGFLPTCVTSPIESYAEWLSVAAASRPEAGAAHVFGIHLEGVYFSHHKMGAHNPSWMRPIDVDEVLHHYACHPVVRVVTIAPELEGALDAIRALKARGIIVSAGHSNATYEEARSGLQAGISWGTHIFNAMRDLRHREPGIAAAMLLADVPVGLIADGVHVHPAIVELVWRVKGPRRVTLVTDAMTAMGMPPGEYALGRFSVTVDDRSARLSNGTLAGSIITMDGAIRFLMQETGCSLADALTMASRTPAELLGLARKGRIAVGCDADLVVLDPTVHVQATFIGGKLAHAGGL